MEARLHVCKEINSSSVVRVLDTVSNATTFKIINQSVLTELVAVFTIQFSNGSILTNHFTVESDEQLDVNGISVVFSATKPVSFP